MTFRSLCPAPCRAFSIVHRIKNRLLKPQLLTASTGFLTQKQHPRLKTNHISDLKSHSRLGTILYTRNRTTRNHTTRNHTTHSKPHYTSRSHSRLEITFRHRNHTPDPNHATLEIALHTQHHNPHSVPLTHSNGFYSFRKLPGSNSHVCSQSSKCPC
jgi:hypothetical protein